MELTVAGGYFQPGKTPQIINKVNELITLGYVPYGTPTYNEASGWISQLMVLGYGGSATDYTLTTGYLDKTPYFKATPPDGDGWVLLGSLLARSNNFYVHAWVNGVNAGTTVDLANTTGTLPLSRTTGTLDFGTRVTGNVPLASRVSGTLPIANGGTGATTADAARANLVINRFYQNSPARTQIGATDSTSTGAYLELNDSGTWGVYKNGTGWVPLAIAQGGTGATTAAAAWTALGGGSIGKLNSVSLTTNVTGTLPIANGGTGATTADAAWTALGGGSVGKLNSVSLTANVSGTLPITSGGTGATTADAAWTALGGGSIGKLNSISLTANVSGTLPIANGGTGATTAANAWTALGGGSIGKLNSVSLTTNVSGTLPVANGGTGATTADAAWTALGGGSVGKLDSVSLTANVTGTLPIANGGTGATTAANAWTALGGGTVGKLNSVSLTANVTGTLPIANGGTGATTYAAARVALGVDRLVLTTSASEVAVLSVNSSNKIVMWGSGSTVSWGCVNTAGVWTPLPVDRGGTGATNAADARANLGAAAASDRNIKHDIQAYDGLQSLANIEAIIPRTFIFNDDPLNRVRRGVIAQEMQDIDPEYATSVTRSRLNDDGIHVTTEDILILDNNALLVDALIAIKVLAARVAELEDKLK